jgi:hypothetical protein
MFFKKNNNIFLYKSAKIAKITDNTSYPGVTVMITNFSDF